MKTKMIALVVALLLLLGLTNSLYTVRENEYACTVRFSQIIETTAQPGLHFKVPFLDHVRYFTKATQFYDIPPSEVLTSDNQNMTVDCYVLWKVSDPLKFYQTLGSASVAEERLNALTYNALKNVMETPNYAIRQAVVFCNDNVRTKDNILYCPIYMLMFLNNEKIVLGTYKLDLSGLESRI